ncbi:bifunctional protein-serine/threonine kinase/phosphatase [Verrucomicrobiaceae bacterium 5K15]|uniref:Bifunctional protein-serine/threonine kinase/phosphatase n=1 Tax=Oceaniferula flava TaxID=2800421 RepID=A0AAE2SEK6_9BACT|nr:protein kinase [Oceaniferula flavus]MBK1855489.1 bifunctional protein-serine/threonine kinase/phosphatase [Oceaniferula flavus]MBM1136795.1 bifunctional protein-serine/threonine kinase/phosphatase [Oceaniferula flavus]
MSELPHCHPSPSDVKLAGMKNHSPAPSRLRVEAGQCSLCGPKEQNEDCTGVRVPDDAVVATKGIAAVVADGVSAANGGKVAGEMCVQGFLSDYFCTPETWTVKTSAQRVLDSLNRWLYGQGSAEGFSDEKGYVSTHSSLVLCSRTGFIFHVGDSRIYRVRDGEIEQLTRDHRSMVSKASFLNRAMGLSLNLKVDYREADLQVDDLFILCTDGVHDFISDQEIRKLADSEGCLDDIAAAMAQRALDSGGDDNTTCVLVKVESLPDSNYEEAQRVVSERPFPPLLAPGMKIDGLEVEEVMVESKRSQLYRVRDLNDGRMLVMKTPSVNFKDDPEYIERFAAEEWVGKRVEHKNLVRVIDRDSKPTFLYYLMESLDGQNLADWLHGHQGRPPIDEVVAIVRQIVSGVRALHRKEVLHQDLKLENIIVDAEGKVTVIDYGSCRIAGLRERLGRQDDDALGTLDFSAPEYRMPTSSRIGPRADQFSIAMIAYHLLSGGKCPYGEKWAKAKSPKDFSQLEYVPLYHHYPMVPVWLDGAVARAVEIVPGARYQGMSEWVYDLEHPSDSYSMASYLPLIERNPVKFWQTVSAVLAGIIILLLVIK